VLGDAALQQVLDAASDAQEFAALASRLAREHGIELSAADMLLELNNARQSWMLRLPQ
jgi:hypothetical protein